MPVEEAQGGKELLIKQPMYAREYSYSFLVTPLHNVARDNARERRTLFGERIINKKGPIETVSVLQPVYLFDEETEAGEVAAGERERRLCRRVCFHGGDDRCVWENGN